MVNRYSVTILPDLIKTHNDLLKRACILLIMLVISQQLIAQPVFRKRDQTTTPTGSTVTLTHDLSAVSGDYLYTVVGVSVRSRSISGTLTPNEEAVTVTFQGESMIYIGGVTNQANAKTYLFGFAEPAKISGSVSVTFSGAIDNTTNAAVIGAMTFSNVDPTNPYNTFTSVNGSSNATSLSVSPVAPANSVVFSAVTTDQKNITNPSGEFWNVSYGDVRGAGRVQAASGNPTNVTWTVSNTSSQWSLAAVSLNAVPVSDLGITKSVSKPSPFIGETITFTLVASNSGPNNAPTVEVSDLLPAGYTFVSSTPSQGTYNGGTGLWDVGTLNASASATLTITAVVRSTGSYLNTATISSANVIDSVPGNNTASVSIVPCQAGGNVPLFGVQ